MMPYRFDQRRLSAAILEGAQQGVEATLIRYQNRLRRKLSVPGLGRLYRRGQGKAGGRNLRERGFHRASRPGQPPAVDTGTLRNSWQVGALINRAGLRDRRRPTIRLGSKVKYAPFLEYGTRRMRPRPYLDPTVKVLIRARIPQNEVAARIRAALARAGYR